jgi:cadmium resistance transport/sequestration family protein
MNLLTTISTGVTAFAATNLDDIIILMLFFSQVNAGFRYRQIVTGQYLGFGALVLTSLTGFWGSLLLPRPWIGLLGLVPIAIGINRLFNLESEAEGEEELVQNIQSSSWLAGILSPQAYSVAAITFANGGDNIGIYVPLFASNAWEELVIILGVFFSLVGFWCYTAFQLTRLPLIAKTLTRYGNLLIPFVLIGLGILILLDSHTLEYRGLTALALAIGGWILISLLRQSSIPLVQPDHENL